MFTKPDDITTLSAADLDALRAEAVQEFDSLNAIEPADLTDEQVDRMEVLAEGVSDITVEGDKRVTAAADRAARIEAASGVLTAAKAAADKPPVQPAPVAEPGKPAENTNTPEDGSGAGQKINAPVPPSTTVAAQRTSVVAAVAAQGGKSGGPKRTGGVASIRAAADVPGFPAASDLGGMEGITRAFTARAGTLGRGGAGYQRLGVATIHKDTTDVLTASGDAEADYKAIMEAGREDALDGGSLVAAGGWCAPSETFYDLCQTESLDGLIDIPEVNVNRGGIRFTKGPAFEDIYASAGFYQTETQAIAGTAKPCATISCPDFTEIRLDAIGTCVSAPILTNVGYPELVQRWIEGTMVAHEHKKSLRTINSMVAIAGTATKMKGLLGTGMDLLAALEWIAETTRYRYRMPFASTLEVVLPHWLLPIVRQDLAMRQGLDLPQITDQQITALFANRGTRVQWVYDWQPLDLSGNKCVAPVPATVSVLAYPAGTFVRGTTDVISLDTVYDTAGLQQNTYTAVFMEEGMLVANRCYSACQFTVPLAAQGSTAGPLASGASFNYLPTP